jgi:predicted nuclease of predicted toxin-antitoxin system
MKVLFDQGTPAPLRQVLPAHHVATAHELGWSTLENGALIAAAESAGYQVLITTDRNLKYQQNLSARSLAIVVLMSTSWPRIRRSLPRVVAAVDASASGTYVEVAID